MPTLGARQLPILAKEICGSPESLSAEAFSNLGLSKNFTYTLQCQKIKLTLYILYKANFSHTTQINFPSLFFLNVKML